MRSVRQSALSKDIVQSASFWENASRKKRSLILVGLCFAIGSGQTDDPGRNERSMEQTAPEGLRQRKKEMTRQQIERAILELSLDNGYENVTVEDVCERCDISKGTFFNYYASKESAVLGTRGEFPDGDRLHEMLEDAYQNELVRRDVACAASSSSDSSSGTWNYLDAVVVSTQTMFNMDEGREEIVALRKELLSQVPQLLFGTRNKGVGRMQQSVTCAVGAFLEAHPECRLLRERSVGEESVVAASAVMNIMRTRAILSVHGDHVMTARETRKLIMRFLSHVELEEG